MDKHKIIDLNNPVDAKIFLHGVRFGGKAVTHVLTEDKKQIEVESMTDEQLVRYAKDIYLDYCGGVEGENDWVELETEGQEQ